MVAHTVLVGAGLVSFFVSPAAEADEGRWVTVICRFGIVGLGWAESGSSEGSIAGGLRPLQAVGSFLSLVSEGALVGFGRTAGFAAAAASSSGSRGGGGGQKRTTGYGLAQCRRGLHGAGGTSSVQQ